MNKKFNRLLILYLIITFLTTCGEGIFPNPGGGDADGSQPVPWTSVTKLEIRPDTAAVGDTVFIKVSIKDSLVTGTKYYWSSAAFPFLDGNLSGANYITEMGENRVYLSPSDIPDSAFSTDSTVLSWRGSIYISNPPLPGGGLQQLFYIKIKKD